MQQPLFFKGGPTNLVRPNVFIGKLLNSIKQLFLNELAIDIDLGCHLSPSAPRATKAHWDDEVANISYSAIISCERQQKHQCHSVNQMTLI